MYVVNLVHQGMAFFGEFDQDGTAISGVGASLDQPLALDGVYQCGDVARRYPKYLREIAHADATLSSGHRQQMGARHRESRLKWRGLHTELAELLQRVGGEEQRLGEFCRGWCGVTFAIGNRFRFGVRAGEGHGGGYSCQESPKSCINTLCRHALSACV